MKGRVVCERGQRLWEIKKISIFPQIIVFVFFADFADFTDFAEFADFADFYPQRDSDCNLTHHSRILFSKSSPAGAPTCDFCKTFIFYIKFHLFAFLCFMLNLVKVLRNMIFVKMTSKYQRNSYVYMGLATRVQNVISRNVRISLNSARS